jgi:hypothetical protein
MTPRAFVSHLHLILGHDAIRVLRNRRGQTLVAAFCCALFASACGGGGGNDKGTSADAASRGFAAANFGVPARGANKWLPLKPGTQWVREGRVNVGHRRLSHRVISTVTDVSKRVDGVLTVGVLDQDFNGGQVAEQSVDWLGEDKRGNVWDLGSYTESYEGGQFVNASDARLAGIKGSRPGILMRVHPRVGDEWLEAKAIKTGQKKCVPFKCYRDVLVIQEGSGGSEYKYWAPGVGQLSAQPRSNSTKQEVEVLVNLVHLSPRALSDISAEVLKLDRNARGQAKDVFDHAPAAKRTL